MIKVIIFDWGNVIKFYYMELFYDNMSKYLKVDKEQFALVELASRIKLDAGEISSEQFIQNLNSELHTSLTVKKYYDLIKSFKTEKLNAELVELMKLLKQKYEIFLLSNNSPYLLDEIKYVGLEGFFDKQIISYQVKLKKPDPRIFELLLKDTPFDFSDCLFIDDREDCCETAAKLGMNSIVFKSNEQLKKEMRSLGIIE